MSIEELSANTLQAVAWKEQNESIPENHLNDIIECALNMPSTSNTKEWSVWVPHREGLLEDALSCATTWSSNCCQDTFFRNAKTMLVYMVKETEHTKNTHPADYLPDGPSVSYFGQDEIMDQMVKNDWEKTKKIIDNQLIDEQSRKNSKKFDGRPSPVVPFWGWNPEHLQNLYVNIGLAMGASILKIKELGYWHQFQTVYRQTTSWHTRFGNKFNQDGKWWPLAIQIIGTKPAGAKINTRAVKPEIRPDAHTIEFGDRHISSLQEKEGTEKKYEDKGFPVLISGHNYRSLEKTLPKTISDHHIKFFMEHYGKYSSDPRQLYKYAFGTRVENCEKILDEWMAKNN